MRCLILMLVSFIAVFTPLKAQVKPELQQVFSKNSTPYTEQEKGKLYFKPKAFSPTQRPFTGSPISPQPVKFTTMGSKSAMGAPLKFQIKQTPRFFEPSTGYTVQKNKSNNDLQAHCLSFLDTHKKTLLLNDPEEEFKWIGQTTDKSGREHIRMQQVYNGLNVYGAEIVLHFDGTAIRYLNGRYYATPVLPDLTPAISGPEAILLTKKMVGPSGKYQEISKEELEQLEVNSQENAELIIFFKEGTDFEPRLAWQVEWYPNIADHWTCLIDAETGEKLRSFSHICKARHPHEETIDHSERSESEKSTSISTPNRLPSLLFADGPKTVTAKDLFGQNRTINTYEKSGVFYLIDASRNMFNATTSVFPDEPVGVVWTLNAGNKSPSNDDFDVTHVTSANNAWTNASSVSAHYNAGVAFQYYQQTFGRNSINGRGGNIVSIINVSEDDGTDMDNAFWNGAYMFYGNGNQAFTAPLSKSLDVAGHEMTHGVIQSTANLDYYGESGAINESMADVFGAMMDRNDWKLGEDIVNTSIYKSGALRDLSNPHNGGTNLRSAGWQPDHVSEQYTGSEDNNGVHINSGITNKAFYLFATAVGKEKAEQVYYHALQNILTRSSKFIDLRLAIIKSCQEVYPNEPALATAAGQAFDAVGIVGDTGTNTQEQLPENPGEDYVLYTDLNKNTLNIVTASGAVVIKPFPEAQGPLSKPSITDDGSRIVYVAKDKTIRVIDLDWSQGTYEYYAASESPVWRNAAISKDGNRLAVTTDVQNNEIEIYNLASATPSSKLYKLYNPTYTEGVETGDVQYADVMEWDYTGELLMYDAFNAIQNASGAEITYWDIGFMRVWNETQNTFGDGFISKLFSGLPENTSVGNPTFAKTVPYIIALDYVDETNEEYYLVTANTQTGDMGTLFQNSDLSFPSFSTDDKKIIFDAFSTTDKRVVAQANLSNDKLDLNGQASILISDNSTEARWGVWFAIGDRVLTNTETLGNNGTLPFAVFPNPAASTLNVQMHFEQPSILDLSVADVTGRILLREPISAPAGEFLHRIDLSKLPSGQYSLRMSNGNNFWGLKFVKME